MTCRPDFECEFDPYDDSDEESWHYRKTCASCGKVWWGLHCDCDGVQNPCPYCGARVGREDDADGVAGLRRQILMRVFRRCIAAPESISHVR